MDGQVGRTLYRTDVSKNPDFRSSWLDGWPGEYHRIQLCGVGRLNCTPRPCYKWCSCVCTPVLSGCVSKKKKTLESLIETPPSHTYAFFQAIFSANGIQKINWLYRHCFGILTWLALLFLVIRRSWENDTLDLMNIMNESGNQFVSYGNIMSMNRW